MTVREIVGYPDARLRTKAQPVLQFDDALRVLAIDLIDTMRAAPGIGITAPHIGVALRLAAIELPGAEPRVYVNPEIVAASPETVRHDEGSVSMPGASEEVQRHAHVQIRYMDVEGVEHSEAADGLLAICLQHEIDQLDGIFWLQRLSRLKRNRLIKRYEKRARR